MSAHRMIIQRMATTREGPTKYEHFVTIENTDGRRMEVYMRYKPEEALYSATELGLHLGIPVEPLVIDGKTVELDEIGKMMLEKD
jgi:hypothetical protein